MKLEFTKSEVARFKAQCYFSKEEEQILDLRLENNHTIEGIAMIMNMSVATVNRRIKNIKKKIMKVL